MLPQLAMQLYREKPWYPKSCHKEIVNMARILFCKWMKNEGNRIKNFGRVNRGPCAQFPCNSLLDNMVLCQELRNLVAAGHLPRPKFSARGGVVKVSNYMLPVGYYMYVYKPLKTYILRIINFKILANFCLFSLL